MPNIIRECHVPHHGDCDAVLSDATVVATLEAHGFEAKIVHTGVEAFEPATIIPFDGGPVRDASAWVAVPSGVHGLAEWLGY
jgi:hypothetical protein